MVYSECSLALREGWMALEQVETRSCASSWLGAEGVKRRRGAGEELSHSEVDLMSYSSLILLSYVA